MSRFVCSVGECLKPRVARGLCWKHYARRRRHGNAEVTKRRYKMPHECRYCGVTRPDAFYPYYKSVCKQCRKLKTIEQSSM